MDKLELVRIKASNHFDESHRYCTPHGTEIKSVNTSKDLGILFDNNGTFKSHIENKCAQSRKISGYILRAFKTRNSYVLLTLFKSKYLNMDVSYGILIDFVTSESWNKSRGILL